MVLKTICYMDFRSFSFLLLASWHRIFHEEGDGKEMPGVRSEINVTNTLVDALTGTFDNLTILCRCSSVEVLWLWLFVSFSARSRGQTLSSDWHDVRNIFVAWRAQTGKPTHLECQNPKAWQPFSIISFRLLHNSLVKRLWTCTTLMSMFLQATQVKNNFRFTAVKCSSELPFRTVLWDAPNSWLLKGVDTKRRISQQLCHRHTVKDDWKFYNWYKGCFTNRQKGSLQKSGLGAMWNCFNKPNRYTVFFKALSSFPSSTLGSASIHFLFTIFLESNFWWVDRFWATRLFPK